MITFDTDQRQFTSVVSKDQKEYALPGIKTSATVGAVANAAYKQNQRNKYKSELIAKGMSPAEADKEAKKRYGGIASNAAKGAIKGLGARAAVNAADKLGVTKSLKSGLNTMGTGMSNFVQNAAIRNKKLGNVISMFKKPK